MGSLILCHAKKARQPYEISRVHKKIYTIEELCYYIYHHLYLIDDTFVNHQLCDWINDELELERLSEDLKNILNTDGPTEDFIHRILTGSLIYSQSEITKVMDDLRIFNEQKIVEKEKYKADQLMQNGEYESAVFVYLRIINQDWDETIDPSFYGSIYANLGSAYGKLFLYEKASFMYEKAWKYLSEESVLKAYVYACYKAYPEEIYKDFLVKNPDFHEVDKQMRETIKRVNEDLIVADNDLQIQKWKNNNRGFNKI